MEIDVRLDGLDKLVVGIDHADELFAPYASKAIAVSLTAIEERSSTYPPQPDRMRSGHLNTYVRGVGTYPKSAFVPDTKQPGGYAIKKRYSGSIKFTSQDMKSRFKHEAKTSGNVVTGELRNDATYSGYVIGSVTDDPKQADFHAETGWVSKEEAVALAQPEIEKAYRQAVADFLKDLAR